jgi:hypothetical protein
MKIRARIARAARPVERCAALDVDAALLEPIDDVDAHVDVRRHSIRVAADHAHAPDRHHRLAVLMQIVGRLRDFQCAASTKSTLCEQFSFLSPITITIGLPFQVEPIFFDVVHQRLIVGHSTNIVHDGVRTTPIGGALHHQLRHSIAMIPGLTRLRRDSREEALQEHAVELIVVHPLEVSVDNRRTSRREESGALAVGVVQTRRWRETRRVKLVGGRPQIDGQRAASRIAVSAPVPPAAVDAVARRREPALIAKQNLAVECCRIDTLGAFVDDTSWQA